MKKVIKALLILSLFICCSSCKNNNSINVHVISDIHYAPRDLYEYTGIFATNNDTNGTGKQIKYQEEIIDAYINEELKNKPDYILITGDLVYSGYKEAHEKFFDKYKTLIDNGIKVLVLPGNHDFDYQPFSYDGESMVYHERLTKDEFEEIYADFGYNDSISKDENSLSYAYELNNKNFLLALDTLNKYGNTDGEFKQSTLDWIRDQFEYGKNRNMNIIVAGHHNLLIHNKMFDFGYRINNSEELIKLMKEYNVHLYLSGHMHIQDIASNNYLTEVLNESYSIYPHRYGELIVNKDEYTYSSKHVTNFNIDDYDKNGYDFLFNNFEAKSLSKLKDSQDITKEEKEAIDKQTLINVEYFMGLTDNNDYSELEVSNYVKEILKYLSKDKLNISGKLK